MQKTLTHNELVEAVRLSMAPEGGQLPPAQDFRESKTTGVTQFFEDLRGEMGDTVNAFLTGVEAERETISTTAGQSRIGNDKPTIRMEFEGGVAVELSPTDSGLQVSTNLGDRDRITENMRPVTLGGPRQQKLAQGLAMRDVTREKLTERLLAEADRLQADLVKRKTT